MIMVLIVDSELLNGFAKHSKFVNENTTTVYIVCSQDDKLDISDVLAVMSNASYTKYVVVNNKAEKATKIAQIVKEDCYYDNVVIVSTDKAMGIIEIMFQNGWFKAVSSLDEAVAVIRQRKAEIDAALAEYDWLV